MGQCNSTTVTTHSPIGRSEGRVDPETQQQGNPPLQIDCSSLKSFHFSVSLDQASNHSVCIRVELLEGQKPPRLEEGSTTVNQESQERKGAPSKQSPDANTASKHHKDICFTAPSASESQQDGLGTNHSQQQTLDYLHKSDHFYEISEKIESRRNAFRCLTTSDGALLDATTRERLAGVQKENSWYHLQMMDSAGSLDLHDALQGRNGSTHSHTTISSWGGLSVRKSLKGWQDVQVGSSCNNNFNVSSSSSSSSSGNDFCRNKLPPVIDISMNDVSGNTLPTRCEEETENDEEVDQNWEYRRKICALAADAVLATSAGIPPTIIANNDNDNNNNNNRIEQEQQGSSPTIHSMLPFPNPTLQAHSSARLRRTTKLIDSLTCSNDSSISISRRSCQSDPGVTTMGGRRGKLGDHQYHQPLEPWNPQKLPSFRSCIE